MKKFRHIYIEEEILNHPKTISILEKNPNSEKIIIKNYKTFFNRANQNFQIQKKDIKLILAKKKDNFLYDGSNFSNNFGNKNFYYNTLILNCVYNCEYCYLQGMFNSGNIVIFVNEEDFFSSTEQKLNDEIFLCISYETDLLAFEELTGFVKDWILFSYDKPNLKIELRTKSNLFKQISDLKPNPNFILAWTLSPEIVIKNHEENTPTLNRRLESIQEAIKLGWSVRICIDPILHIQNWKEEYFKLIQTIFDKIETNKLLDISLGTFRINKDFLKKMKKLRPDSKILHYPFQLENEACYPKNKRDEILFFLKNVLIQKITEEKIFLS